MVAFPQVLREHWNHSVFLSQGKMKYLIWKLFEWSIVSTSLNVQYLEQMNRSDEVAM